VSTATQPLNGLAVKVTSGFFLLGLSAKETETQRNLELLKERSWFDIPVVYNNGRRAIIAVEKGASGERALAEAFKAWGQANNRGGRPAYVAVGFGGRFGDDRCRRSACFPHAGDLVPIGGWPRFGFERAPA
jgi:hypothetical protein